MTRIISSCLLLLLTVLLGCKSLGPEISEPSPPNIEQKTFGLSHLSYYDAQAFMSHLGLGTVSTEQSPKTILVKGTSSDLYRTKVLLDLVDCNTPYRLEVLGPVAIARDLPTNGQIAALMGRVEIGTFANPPTEPDVHKILMDIHKDRIVAISPEALYPQLKDAIRMKAPIPKQDVSTDVHETTARDVNPEPHSQTVAASPGDTDTQQSPPVVSEIIALETQATSRRAMTTDLEQAAVQFDANALEAEWSVPPADPKPPVDILTNLNVDDANEFLDLSLPDTMRPTELLELVGQYLGFDMVYEAKDIPDEPITLKLHGQLQGQIRIQDLYGLLQTVLEFKGLAMVKKDEHLIAVIPMGEVLDADPAIIDPNSEKIDAGDLVVTRLFALQYVDAASAQKFLESMKLSLAISAIEQTQVLFVTCYTHRLERLERLIRLIDRPGEKRFFRIRTLRYTAVEEIVEQIRTLAGQLQGMPVTISSPLPSKQKTGSLPSAKASQDTVFLDMDLRTNRLITVGSKTQLDVIEKLLTVLDVAPDQQYVLKSYPVRHLDAIQVMTTLYELDLLNVSSVETTDKISPAPLPPGATRRSRAEDIACIDQGPRISVLESTNALLVFATDIQHVRLESLLRHIDVPTQDIAIPYEIYFLENQPPEHVSKTLQRIIQETVTDPEGKIVQVQQDAEDKIVIVPDEPTSSLIVYANRQNQDWINKLIKTLDRRRPQVLIDVTLVEIRKTDEFAYDLNLISGIPDMVQTSRQIGSFTSGGQTVPQNLQSSSRTAFTEFQSNSGAGTGFFGDKHINVLLSAMQSKNYGRILAKPKILVNDNETGTIKTTEETYVSKKSSIPVSSGGGGNNATLIETAVEYESYDAGITLEITPHASEGDLLRLDIILNRSDFGTITGDTPPDKSSSDLTTNVTVPDASTIILGGMLRLNQTKAGKKVPILGDLPLIGLLFRGASSKDIQNKLYIFVRAEIIRPEETLRAAQGALKRVSDQNRAAFEQHEKDFQNYETLPLKRDERLDPDHVLEMK